MQDSLSSAIVGVLALQGAFIEHIKVLKNLKIKTIEVRNQTEINSVDALIIPGGESSVINQLLDFNLPKIPIFGTCAGCIILSQLGLIDIKIERNAYGSQLDSFEADLNNGFHGVFIRAPKITSIGKNVEVLAKHNDEPVLVRQGKYLAATFHPELTNDTSIHELFLNMI